MPTFLFEGIDLVIILDRISIAKRAFYFELNGSRLILFRQGETKGIDSEQR